MLDGKDGVRFSWFIPIDGDGSRAGYERGRSGRRTSTTCAG